MNPVRICLACLAAIAICQSAVAETQDELVRGAVQKVAPSVVRIRIIGGTDSDNLSVTSRTVTGVAVSESGDIITSAFGFTEESPAIFVNDAEGNRVAAKVVATDHVRKLVLLKTDGGSFRPVEANDEVWPAVGKTAIALGRFYNTKVPTVSVGIVSAVRRIHGLAIQTDAKISPVNYGGPLVDLDGRVLGILVPLSPQDSDGISAGVEWYDSGIGFCIPLSEAIETAKLLRSSGDRHRGIIGVVLSTRNPLETDFHIVRTHPDSPAALAGLQEDDRIVEAGGQQIPRFGVFQSVVKSSYAGDRLPLKIKRGEQTVEAEIVLAQKLKVPERGQLGVIVLKTVEKKEEQPAGVLVRVVPGGALANAGVSDTVVVCKWDDEDVDTAIKLKQKLIRAIVGQSVSLGFRAAGESKLQTVEVSPAKASNEIPELPDDVVKIVADLRDDVEWKRSVEPLGKSEDKVWFYAPDVSPEVESGLIILLNRSSEPPESTLRTWEDVCHQHNLIIAVVQPKDKSPLSREHVGLVRESIKTVARGRSIDTDRLLLVTESDQTEVCTDVLWNPRAVGVRSAVFIDCRPQSSGISQEIVMRKGIATLFFTGQIQSRQELALQRQAVTALNEAGARVTEVAGQKEASVTAGRIADWAIGLKVR